MINVFLDKIVSGLTISSLDSFFFERKLSGLRLLLSHREYHYSLPLLRTMLGRFSSEVVRVKPCTSCKQIYHRIHHHFSCNFTLAVKAQLAHLLQS